MNTLNPILPLRFLRIACLFTALPVLTALGAADDKKPQTTRATDEKIVAAVRAADDARLAATKAADRAALSAIYSDDLHYAHSNGKIDTKSSQIDGITSGNNKYEGFDHKQRDFVQAAPGIVLVKGRLLVNMASKTGQKTTNDLNYLAVWRNENGKWRFLAWQSCKNPEPTATKK